MRTLHALPVRLAGAAGLAVALTLTAGAQAPPQPAPDRDAMIRSALSAAPVTLRDTVKVMDFDGNVLRDGPPGFTCLPAPPGIAGPMCVDEVFMGWVQAWSKKEPPNVQRLGISYMMAGDAPDGGASNTAPFDTQPSAANDWMVEGPHIMIVVPDPALLQAIGGAHHHGGPYVMWEGTPWAHVMIPVGERPPQRSVAGR
jgi:hypothetical protein